MLQSLLLTIAAVIVALSATNQVFRGTKSPVPAGLTGVLTVPAFLWAAGRPGLGIIVVICLLLLTIPARS